MYFINLDFARKNHDNIWYLSTYISPVIDLYLAKKVTSVKCFNLKYQWTTKHSRLNNIMKQKNWNKNA